MGYVVLEIRYDGTYASAKENFILSIEVFNKYKEQILEILSKSWYPELNGKHNHVDGEYSYGLYDEIGVLNFFKSRDYVGLGRTLDCLQENLYEDIFEEINADMNKIANYLFSQIKELELKIDLTVYEDTDAERDKIIKLLNEHGYNLI